MQARLRRARPVDLEALRTLEEACFEPHRRSSPRSLHTSLTSLHQEVWVHWCHFQIVSCLILRLHLRAIRVFSVAVHPDYQGQGLGRSLLRHALRRARQRKARTISLEAASADRCLLQWYADMGFQKGRFLRHYYAHNHSAWRMNLTLSAPHAGQKSTRC